MVSAFSMRSVSFPSVMPSINLTALTKKASSCRCAVIRLRAATRSKMRSFAAPFRMSARLARPSSTMRCGLMSVASFSANAYPKARDHNLRKAPSVIALAPSDVLCAASTSRTPVRNTSDAACPTTPASFAALLSSEATDLLVARCAVTAFSRLLPVPAALSHDARTSASVVALNV